MPRLGSRSVMQKNQCLKLQLAEHVLEANTDFLIGLSFVLGYFYYRTLDYSNLMIISSY